MRPDRLLLPLPPLLALLCGYWTAPAPLVGAAAGDLTPEVDEKRLYVPVRCEDPELSEAITELADRTAALETARLQAEQRLRRFEQTLYAANEACAFDLEVLAIDCAEEPCVFAVPPDRGKENWWDELKFCPPWYEAFGVTGGGHSRGSVTCPDGTTVPYESFGGPGAEVDGPHDLTSRAWAVQGSLRRNEAFQEALCP